MRVLIFLMAALLAGCADVPVEPEEEGPTAAVTDETGAICAVVVDQTITPVTEATVTLAFEGDVLERLTDAEGMVCFEELTPGFYTVSVSKIGYGETSIQANAEAGKVSETLRLQIEKLFDQDPFVSQFKFEGRLACHIQAGLTAPCVTDWTQLAPGCGSGCVPQLRTVMGDQRDFIDEVGAGWQSHIVEMFWKPSAQATSSEMGLIIRDFVVGGGSHQFAEMEGESPLHAHIKEGEVHATQGGGEPTMIPSEGYDQIIHFAGVRTADGDVAAAAIEQKFEVFRHTFYYGNAPDEWSFINGDDMPF